MPQYDNLHILIVDDNPEIHRDFIKILTRSTSKKDELGVLEQEIFGQELHKKPVLPLFQIDSASQGQEGLQLVEKALKEGNPYSLAFIDVRMPPGWDGIETIKRIWAVDPDIQIVICTAYSDYTWEETIECLGQRENLLILKKPFDFISVRQLSCALTKKWLLQREMREHTKLLEERVALRTSSLKEALSVTRGTLESSTDAILVVNNKNTVIDHNHKFIELWNISPALMNRNNANELFEYIAKQVKNSKDFLEKVKIISNQPEIVNMHKLQVHDNRVIEYFIQPYKIDEKIIGRIWIYRDITKRALLEEKIEHQATHDILTGLPNRALLTEGNQTKDTKNGVTCHPLVLTVSNGTSTQTPAVCWPS